MMIMLMVFGRYLPFQEELGAEIFTGGRGHRGLCPPKRTVNNIKYLRNYEHLNFRIGEFFKMATDGVMQ